MKKKYIVPNLTIVKVNVQHHMMAGSDPAQTKRISGGFQLGGGTQGKKSWEESGYVEEDADLAISAKHFDAWSSWDE